MSHEYREPGKYVAICNNTNFDGHYIKEFEVPTKSENVCFVDGVVPEDLSASWYFLNVVDFMACVEAVYPKSLFEEVFKKA